MEIFDVAKMSDILCQDTKTGWAAKKGNSKNGPDIFFHK